MRAISFYRFKRSIARVVGVFKCAVTRDMGPCLCRRYFGTDDQSGLSTAIEDALKVSYTVYDQGGNEVASGQVGGEPVELEQGIYNVLVRTQPPQRFEKVDVQGESEVTLEVE